MTEEKKAPPIGAVRAGSVKVSVWKNAKKDGDKISEWKTITIQRGYKDKNDEWQNSNVLNMNDVPKLIQALQEVYKTELSN